MGMAGVLPYGATALTTVYCAYEINHAAEAGNGLFLDEKSAEALLHIVEPLQVGYGAVVCLRIETLLVTPLIFRTRFSPSSAPSTGVSSGPNTAASKATHAT